LIARCGLVWDTPLVFERYIEDCGIACEHVTPQLLAAPFYRGTFGTLIIPAGFGNPAYSRLLPALRASSGRIRHFVDRGGHLLVFGAGDTRPDLYDWVPFPVTYHHNHHTCRICLDLSHSFTSIVADYDPAAIPCDGYFSPHGGDEIATSDEHAVMVGKATGSGIVLVTTIHEYPSRAFLLDFCGDARETLF
jgi:hypothetical protein